MTTEKAVLAGGCFWSMQDMFRRLRGVVSTRAGYTGGDIANPSYGNHQGHAEAIEETWMTAPPDIRLATPEKPATV